MNQFQVFIGEKLTHTDKKNEAMNRLSIHVLYDKWFYFDNELVKTIHLTEEEREIEKNEGKKFRRYIPAVLKYDKRIGRLEFYKLLTEFYGPPPLIHKKTKQYSYYLKKN